jgi:hypothetical protein
MVEWLGEWSMLKWSFYSNEGWESSGSTVVVQIQYFSFSLRGEAIGQNVAERWSRGSEFVFAQWKRSVTRCNGVATSAGWETTSRRRKEGDNVSWTDAALIGPKKKIAWSIQLVQMDVKYLKQQWVIFLTYASDI